MIYNTVYRVPVWVVFPESTPVISELTDILKDNGAHVTKWVSDTFPATIADLGSKGWSHEVDRPMPFLMNPDFLSVAISTHIKANYFGRNLIGSPLNPMRTLNRKIQTGEDYVRLFNDFFKNEEDITLSHLFSIGEKCYEQGVRVFVTAGKVPNGLLQKVSDNVITVGDGSCDLDIALCTTDEAFTLLDSIIAEKLVKRV